MDELKWKWVYIPYLDAPDEQKESAIKAGYAKVYFKSEADKVIADLEESHDVEIGRLRAELEYSAFKPDIAKVIAKKDAVIAELKASQDARMLNTGCRCRKRRRRVTNERTEIF